MARTEIGTERREQILAAFEACVIRYGFAKTTLQKIADEAELTRPLVRYFIGNRSDMVPLIIDRMIERFEGDLSIMRLKDGPIVTSDIVDFMFDSAFANETSNSLIGELRNLAQRDEAIRMRVAKMYQIMLTILTSQMAKDGIGCDENERSAAAHVLMSLAYGDASFTYLFRTDQHRAHSKKAAQIYLSTLVKETSRGQRKEQI